MKNLFLKFCLLACIALLAVACSNSEKLAENEFLIEGRISGVEDGAMIRLFRTDGNSGEFIAADTLQNERFRFKSEAISNPEKMLIICMDEGYPSQPFFVWVAPGARVKITGKDKLLPAWEVKSSISYQKEENRYTNKSRSVIKEQAKLAVEYSNLRTKARAASSEEEALAYREKIDSLEVIENSLIIKQFFSDIDIMEKTDISPIWLDKMRAITMTLKFSDLDIESADNLREKAKKLYGRISEEDKNTLIGHEITANLFPPSVAEIGDDMVDTDFFDINGNTKHLSDYAGKYLLLDFWNRGCAPCIMALPEMKEVSETYSDKLTIISISLDSDAAWKEAMKTHDMPWVNIRDPKAMGGLAADYGVSGIPNYIMISPEGKIIDKWMGYGTGLIKTKMSENIK